MKLKKVNYGDLDSRQQKAFNFQKVSGVLADFGFTTIRLTDDWQGADFIAHHIDGQQFLRVQLKGRCTIAKKYCGKSISICFKQNEIWYLVPHDEFFAWVSVNMKVVISDSWISNGEYSFPCLSAVLKAHLEQYKLLVDDLPMMTT